MKKEHKITACGLSCEVCDSKTMKTQESANYLLEIFKDPMISGVISMTNPNFKQENMPTFNEMLEILSKFPPCPGCMGRKDCVINQCVKERGIDNCSECEFLDFEAKECKAPPKPSNVPMMPPAPIFFNGLSRRYRNRNIQNLEAIAKGNKEEVYQLIDNMIKNNKTSREWVDTSVNLFNSKL
ncbi:MAG: DUF3795 domain-containing protein [Promethearchaeota archaeon]